MRRRVVQSEDTTITNCGGGEQEGDGRTSSKICTGLNMMLHLFHCTLPRCGVLFFCFVFVFHCLFNFLWRGMEYSGIIIVFDREWGIKCLVCNGMEHTGITRPVVILSPPHICSYV